MKGEFFRSGDGSDIKQKIFKPFKGGVGWWHSRHRGALPSTSALLVDIQFENTSGSLQTPCSQSLLSVSKRSGKLTDGVVRSAWLKVSIRRD